MPYFLLAEGRGRNKALIDVFGARCQLLEFLCFSLDTRGQKANRKPQKTEKNTKKKPENPPPPLHHWFPLIRPNISVFLTDVTVKAQVDQPLFPAFWELGGNASTHRRTRPITGADSFLGVEVVGRWSEFLKLRSICKMSFPGRCFTRVSRWVC